MSLDVVPSGIGQLDSLVGGIRLGDNVVWQVDEVSQYMHFARAFAWRAVRDKRVCVYLRFAAHPPVLAPQPGLSIIELDPSSGFDPFSAAVHSIAEEKGRGAFYVFDNLSALVAEWATDELLASFFQFTCPFLFQMATVAYFGLTRHHHGHTTVARIRDTTQLLLDVYRVQDEMHVHPLKVWDRYSPRMFLAHVVSESEWQPVYGSARPAAPEGEARRSPLATPASDISPWESVYSKLRQHVDAGDDEDARHQPEVAALRHELARLLIGSHPEFNRLADEYLTQRDLLAIRERLIGSGRIGGKAGGMLVARRILLKDPGEFDFAEILEDHDSFYIGSDVFFSFLVHNDLFRLRLQLSRSQTLTREEFEAVEQRFLAGRFQPEILDQFESIMDYFGQAPIIVRSSSLLEDSFGSSFAGKYYSEFCPNQGERAERLRAFQHAVKTVYASTLNPDALSYRRRRGLGESDELMAILVQRVSGKPYKNLFFPPLAGVAFSRNLYAWTDRIDPRQGMIRLVLGLGTQAVNRVGGGYPRMVAISHPLLRPEIGTEVVKYSQREVDVLDLRENAFQTRLAADILRERDLPGLNLFVSELRDGGLFDPVGCNIDVPASGLVLTLNNLLKNTPLTRVMGEALRKLERAYQQPVDTEFTARIEDDGKVKVNLLQCRPLRLPGGQAAVAIPANVPQESVLFRASRTISGGVVRNIRYILYIDPESYANIPTQEQKRGLGRVVGQVNALPQVHEQRLLMMGPGRWGSSNIDLGVNVTYADIDNTSVLVELAREQAGQVPEVSYGTHFFQDLVEGQVIYLPVYPDDPKALFNEAFFRNSPNGLARLVPALAGFEPWVRVLDVAAICQGACAHVIADPQAQVALCYLGPAS